MNVIYLICFCLTGMVIIDMIISEVIYIKNVANSKEFMKEIFGYVTLVVGAIITAFSCFLKIGEGLISGKKVVLYCVLNRLENYKLIKVCYKAICYGPMH